MRRPARALALLAFLALGGAALGCAAVGLEPRLDGPCIARLLAERGARGADVVVPWEMTDAMRAWAHRAVPASKRPAGERLQLLLRALLDADGLGVAYDASFTGTAAEVFAARRGNCLAFTNLFVGMARELALPVFYLDVGDLQRFEREGDLVVVSGHVSAGTAGYAGDREVQVLDFTIAPIAEYRELRRISDRAAASLYYSNRGGDLLRAGRFPEALSWLEGAVALAPDLAGGWLNLGVARRRTGDTAGAEAAYRRALEIDPESSPAYQNLASLLRLRGDERAAEGLLAQAGGRNPFGYLILGDLSLVHGRLDEARRLYKRALRLYGEHAEPYAAMGQWAVAAGDLKAARQWLLKAAAIDGDNARVKRLATALQGAALVAPGLSPSGPISANP